MDVHFSDLIDLTGLQAIIQSLYEATGIPHGLVDAEGGVLYEIGWQDACLRFHRHHPLSAARCEESNRDIVNHLAADTFVGRHCLNGLMDFATPIFIEGQHLASIFVGQLLHEPPNLDFFRAQAQQFGFDEAAYLASIQQVPIVTKAKAESLMAFYVQIARMLGEKGLAVQRLQHTEQQLAALNADLTRQVAQTRELAEKNQCLEAEVAICVQTELSLRLQQDHLQALLDSSPVGIACSHLDGQIEYLNRKFIELFGYQLGDIPSLKDWYRLAYPDTEVVDPWCIEVEQARLAGTRPPNLEVSVQCKNGQMRRVIVSVSWVGERRLANFSDITDRWQVERREKTREQILELIAKGSSLPQVLEEIVRAVETENPVALGSILLLSEDGQHLRLGAAPSLPDFYNQAVDGVAIGNNVGSCGTAAFLRQRVIVGDIAHDGRWANYCDLALAAGLGACWSEPIFSSDGRVLGTFAIYHAEPCIPTEGDILQIGHAANLATIAIEHDQVRQELERQARMDFLTGLANRRYFVECAEYELTRSVRYQEPLSLFMLDVDLFKKVNDQYGHKAGDLVLQHLAGLLQHALRGADIIGRIGGEEFAVLLPETDGPCAAEIAERLRQHIANSVVCFDKQHHLSITVSLGVTTLCCQDDNIDGLLRRADGALYAAKNCGRNRVMVAPLPYCAGDV